MQTESIEFYKNNVCIVFLHSKNNVCIVILLSKNNVCMYFCITKIIFKFLPALVLGSLPALDLAELGV